MSKEAESQDFDEVFAQAASGQTAPEPTAADKAVASAQDEGDADGTSTNESDDSPAGGASAGSDGDAGADGTDGGEGVTSGDSDGDDDGGSDSAGDPPVGDTAPAASAPSPTVNVDELVAAMLAAQKKTDPASQAPAEPEPEKTPEDFISAEDKTFLADHDPEDFTQAQKAMQIQHKAELAFTRESMTNQFKQLLSAQLAPLTEATQEAQVKAHNDAISQVHPGWQDELPQLEQWVAKQPSILRKAYDAVLDGGTAQEVIEVYNAFRETNPKAPAQKQDGSSAGKKPAPSGARSSNSAQDGPDPDALAATAAVPSGKREDAANSGADDYESALAEAAGIK